MKTRLRWTVVFAVIVVASLATLVAYALKGQLGRQSSSPTDPATPTLAAPSAGGVAALQLNPGDVWQVRDRPFVRTLSISGNVQAAQSVWLKASGTGTITAVHVREGDAVHKGQVLVTLDPRDAEQRLLQARAQVQSAASQFSTARRSQSSNAALVQQGFISANAAASSEAGLEQAKTALQSAQAAERLAHKVWQDCRVRAPFDGIVSQRLVQNGDHVITEARLLELVDLRRMEMQVNLSVADANLVRPRQVAWLLTQAGAEPMLAYVDRISPAAQSSNRTVAAWLRLKPSPTLSLRHNQYVQGEIELARTTTTAVPSSAVRLDKPSPYVQLIVDNRVVYRKVTIGPAGQSAGESVRAVNVPAGAVVLRGSIGTLPEGTAVTLRT